MTGTFSAQVGQVICTACPRGTICPGFGRIDPALCPAGYICSKTGLSAPNIRCPPGFFCSPGTLTGDPFRNDTTMRPYPCQPGSYCLGGVGYDTVKKGDYLYAQPCTPGFYCEAGCTNPLGSGLCPKGFVCPEGTAVPQPAPKGYSAGTTGTVTPSVCLPGYYSPTIEAVDCYPCPPGTSCEAEGMSVADICPPGTYRSLLEIDGLPCVACPQGTWSKNWQLREKGECITCPTGTVCSVEGNTIPCGWDDLPTPFEPVVNDKGVPTAEYLYSSSVRPAYFSSYQCLSLNPVDSDGTVDPLYQVYFYGELVPPYIDVLGRGPHFRSTNQGNLRYQSMAKCYRNTQRYGSFVYQRFADYYGPQYDIQSGYSHQGYGDASSYSGVWGTGSMYIDLAMARIFDSAFNCTRGFRLMNETANPDLTSKVYTDPANDPSGKERKIHRGDDVWYRGTCETDIICDVDATPKATPCTEGYVCDERTTQGSSLWYRCHEGYVCDFGTTPDTSLEAPQGQFKRLCPPGYYCPDGTGRGQQFRSACPANYFCPTGTAMPYVGFTARDSINRGLSAQDANPFLNVVNLKHFDTNDVRLISDHDIRCFAGVDRDLKQRYLRRFLGTGELSNNVNINYLNVLRSGEPPYVDDGNVTGKAEGTNYRPSVVNEAVKENALCGRDHKWRLVSDAIMRDECDCVTQHMITIAVYRLWQCTASEALDDLGVASTNSPFHGSRDFWFSRIPRTRKRCVFPDSDSSLNLTHGAVVVNPNKPIVSYGNAGCLNVTHGLRVQYSWLEARNFSTYAQLKSAVEPEFQSQYTQALEGKREALDPYTYDLRYATRMVEQFGERLEELIWVDRADDGTRTPGRLDMCECERLLRCPNGTVSKERSTSVYDCVKTGEVLLRVNAIANFVLNGTYDPESAVGGRMKNFSDFKELSGSEDYSVGTLQLNDLEAATITMNLSSTARNLTYDEHWRLSVYVNCKPCPPRYKCDYTQEPPTCSSPSYETQLDNFKRCLDRHKMKACVNTNGTGVPCSSPTAYQAATYMEPDLYKCRQIPFFCDDKSWDYQTWRVLKDKATGLPLRGSLQETSTFKTHVRDAPYMRTTGCCACEPHSLPIYFRDSSTVDDGFSDNKHAVVQVELQALRACEVTVVLELLHGLYYTEFRAAMANKGDLYVHTPHRAFYTPTKPSKRQFYAVIVQDDFDGTLELPYNLPQELKRKPTTTEEVYTTFENTLLVKRPTQLDVADPRINYKVAARQRDYLLANPPAPAPPGTLPYFDDGVDITADPEPVVNLASEVKKGETYWDSADPSGTFAFLTLPYLPFFSNCRGYDQYIGISKLLEAHPDCTIIPYDKTRYVNQYFWYGMFSPLGDTCQVPVTWTNDEYGNQVFTEAQKGIDLNCTIEEDVVNPANNPRWFEAPLGTTLFHLTQEPLQPNEFLEQRDAAGRVVSRWGRSEVIEKILGTYHLKDATVGNQLSTSGYTLVIPRRVQMTIRYYQVTKGYKRLVDVNIEFVTQCTTIKPVAFGGSQAALDLYAKMSPPILPCDVDINGDIISTDYVLEVNFYPLRWFELLNLFQFGMIMYIIFYTIVGLLSIVLIGVVYLINRLLTKLRNPPIFQSLNLFYLLGEAPLEGVMIGYVPFALCVMWIYLWLMAKSNGGVFGSSDPVNNPSTWALENVAGSWTDENVLDAERVEFYRDGRLATCFFVLGVYGVLLTARLAIPDWENESKEPDNPISKAKKEILFEEEEEEELPPTSQFYPKIWKRGNFLWATICLNAFLLLWWEFSYSAYYGTYQFVLAIVLVLVFRQVSAWIGDTLKEDLLMNQLQTVNAVTLNLAGMGADSLSNFVIGYFMGLALGWAQAIFIDPAIDEFFTQWPRYKFMLKRQFRARRRMTREEKAAEEAEWQAINEEIELAGEGIEPVLGNFGAYSTGCISYFLYPIMSGFMFVFYKQCTIPTRYGIKGNEMIYYTLFAFYIIPFQMLQDVVVTNTLELVHGWKIYDYIAYQRYRFSVRDYRWILRNEFVDESVAQGMQTLDLMCFSSQYYFILTVFGLSNSIIQVAIEMFLYTNYNPFGDPALVYIIIVMIVVIQLVKYFCYKAADIKVKRIGWRGLWMTKQIEGTVDDEVAAKLAVGEGRQADLEQERLELQALNSERFRHRFVERNKPWILQHLVDLLTPQALKGPGPEGRPLVEYVRDVYAELLGMGEGQRRPGDRSDISDDEEDDAEDKRRQWPATPLVGTSLLIARLWLEKARKRRGFLLHIQGIVQSNKDDKCYVCGRTEEQGVVLTCGLATNKESDPYAIDRLIAGFEQQYGLLERDANLWKAFFRANAEFITRCNICERQTRGRAVSREAETVDAKGRADEVSSDEDEEDVYFEPMVISRSSVVGRIMAKWLTAVRTKLGGEFPRPQARKEMERYVEKLRRIKLKKGKKKVAGGAEKDDDYSDRMAEWEVKVNAATKAISLRWLRMARDSVEKKFRERGEKLREDIKEILKKIQEQDDWFFGAEFRLEGEQLLNSGVDLRDDQRNLAAEVAVKVRKIENDFDGFEKEKRDDINRDRAAFETTIEDHNAKAQMESAARVAELNHFLESKRVEFNMEQKKAREELGAAPTEMQDRHRQALADIEEQIRVEQQEFEGRRAAWEQEQRSVYDQKERLKEQVIIDRKLLATDNILRLKKETTEKTRSKESEWQGKASRWMATASRKVEVKEKEDAEVEVMKKKRRKNV